MSIYISRKWWQNLSRTIKCIILRIEIGLLLYEESDEIDINKIDRLIRFEKYRHPGRSESWYLEKIIQDGKKKFSI